MADVSGVSGSGGIPPSHNVQSQPAAVPTNEAVPSSAADFDQQQDVAFDFLQQELTQGLAAQKADLR